MKSILRLPHIGTAFGFQTAYLFMIDGLANTIDFLFHFWMGRVLIPSDFAILQTLNSVMLVYATASGVFQPVVGRFIAEARGKGQPELIPGIFQSFLHAAFWLGLALGLFTFTFSNPIAGFLNLPPWTIRISAGLIFLSTLRPIAGGVLQGQENFISFGFVRLALSLGRILLMLFLIQSGLGLTAAVLALPFGWLVSVLCAFLLLRKLLWVGNNSTQRNLLQEGWKLSFYTLLAYLAYMLLSSLDLVWINQNLSSESAGAYASLVLLRRVVALLPGVAVVVMFPGIAKALTTDNLPDRLLIRTAIIIVVVSGALTLFYFIFDHQLISIIFGNSYLMASPFLGWMGIAMIGISLSSIWLNFYLAHKPGSFVILLGVAVGLEWLFLNLLSPSMTSAILAFGATGWLLTLSGLSLYLFKVRPTLRNTYA